jgi:Domain of unknown function (DUF4279)
MDEKSALVDSFLVLRGDQLDPEMVTSLLGVKGSKTRKKGEPWLTSNNHEITPKIGVWTLDASRESMSLNDQISSLKKQLESAKSSPLDIPGVDSGELCVFVALGSNDHGGGEYKSELSPDNVAWISRLGVPVSIELTYVPPEQL